MLTIIKTAEKETSTLRFRSGRRGHGLRACLLYTSVENPLLTPFSGEAISNTGASEASGAARAPAAGEDKAAQTSSADRGRMSFIAVGLLSNVRRTGKAGLRIAPKINIFYDIYHHTAK